MDNKDLITRFAEDCFRFEAMQQEIDSLIADEVNEVLIYEYEDLANQAAEIVLKLSANGNNLGRNFYRYYVERLEYIIDYFRALLDYEETPLAEDEQDELDDEPAAEAHFEGFPAGCVFPKFPEFFLGKLEVGENWTAKNEANAATDEAGAVEEDDSEDEQSDKVDNENDAQAAESDEAADDPAATDEAGAVEEDDSEDEQSDEVDNENDAQAAESDEAADDASAGAPVSDFLLPPDIEHEIETASKCWNKLSSEERANVWETFAMWHEMNEITGRNSGGGDYAEAVKVLDDAEWYFNRALRNIINGLPNSTLTAEQSLRKRINRAIDAIPGFRESEKFKKLIELYPTYKEELQ